MFESIKNIFNSIRSAFGVGDGSPRFSRKELRLDADEHAVKRKLGASFFTRRLSPGTRRARVDALSKLETALATDRGWI